MARLTTKRRIVKKITATSATEAKSIARKLYRSGLYGCKVKVVGASIPRKALKPYNVTLELTCTKGK